MTIPSATISRLVTYLRILEQLETEEVARTNSHDLAERAQVNAFQVRKDLAYFGRFGTRGMGYTVPVLKRELMRVLGLTQRWRVIIVGMGRLGQAIANYPVGSDYQFEYVGLFDVNPALIGQRHQGLTIQPMDELHEFMKTHQVDMGFLAVPPEKAQAAAQALAEAGVRGILNFAPTVLQPRLIATENGDEISEEWHNVTIENVDFLAGMKRLAFYLLNPNQKNDQPEDNT
ncbi:redox-sensing transcriptional repressor Rex [Deinococcus lacus]|uniref:Redox-sensing transcriptional repressor Rex n=1 Tax=Deinococcus lacus TaxID=392561 RepID=A0ABW1YB22_9DEIO